MRWKKDVFSYLIWFVYLLAVGAGLLCLISATCEYLNLWVYYGIAAGVFVVLLSGGAVYWLHRRDGVKPAADGGDHGVAAVTEASVAVILLAGGLILRVNGLDGVGQKAAYFEAAAVIPGQSVPQIAQGAVYLYVQFLHGVFYFLGNKMIIGIFCQILLQLLAVLLLYLAARRCVGKIGGTVFLALCMFSGYLRREALLLSPEMLYLVIWAAALFWVVAGNRRRFRVWEFFLTGVLLAVACYLDVAGLILLPVALAVILSDREEAPGPGKKAGACALCVLGLLAGAAGLAGADAALSGKPYLSVVSTWVWLYGPKGLQIPVSLEEAQFPAEYLLTAWLLIFGIFGFWRDRKYDRRKGWIPTLCTALLLGVFGCFTSYLSVGVFLYLLLVLLAGVSVEESFRPGRAAGVQNEETQTTAEETAESGGSREPGRGERAERGLEPGGRLEPGRGERAERGLEPGGSREPGRGERAERGLESGGSREPGRGGRAERQPEAGEGRRKAERKPGAVGSARRPGETQFLENPLPLPKRHVKRRLDYRIESGSPEDDFDLSVDENDDFDI